MGSASAQTTVNFSFQIWKNAVNLGTFTATASTDNSVAPRYVTTAPMLGQLCPGDQLVIKQNCYKNQNNNGFQQLNFNNNSWATIALTSSNLATASTTPIGSVCPSSPSPCLTGTPDFGSWLWNSTVTVTIPNNPTNDNYLAIGNNIFGTGICGLVAFIPINLAPSTSIADQTICPGDVVSIPTVSGFTYSNWSSNGSPNNPNINTPTTTTDYTVDITHTTGCTYTDAFTIRVNHPDVGLSLPHSLCYDRSIQFTENDFYHLTSSGNTSPISLTANGVTLFDVFANDPFLNLPYLIDGSTLGSGPIDFVYTYEKNGVTCSITHTLVIQAEIVLNLQSTYPFCSGNFQPIFATSNGIVGQPGITYNWTQSGVPFSVGAGPYFTPSSYGTYFVTASDEFGCSVRRSFTVYDPGVGIKHPANITFCSVNEPEPNYVGWSSDPFGPIQYSFSWSYTDLNGTTVAIANTGVQYQVPYQGPGTYTAVVNANGCTETINIVVTDLFQVFNNHSNAYFTFTPLGGNEVSCQPTTSMPGTIPLWTVVNQSTNTQVPATTIPGGGIKFTYVTGVQYTVKFRRLNVRRCQEHNNEFTWVDNSGKNSGRNRRNNMSTDNNTKLDVVNTSVNTFPNPTTGLVNIQLTDVETATTQIQVFNALGQVILSKEVQEQNNIELDLSKETSGLYLIQIVNGNAKFSEKIIKE